MKSISAALVKAQKGFAPALKTSTNPHFKSKYADLAACVEAVIDALHANGIALIQKTHNSDTGVTVETVFLHESGEQISCGMFHVPADKQNGHGYGSACTYARRYSLLAACGIAPEDDDGNAASKHPKTVNQDAPKISPVKASLEGVYIDTDTKDKLKALATDLVHYVESCDDPVTAANLYTEAALDSDCRLFLADLLQPNSKTRSALKKELESRKGK